MRLSDLKSNENVEKFSSEVVKNVQTKLKKEISTNKGLKDEEEILKLIRKGKNVKFNYDVLISESEEF